MKEDSVILPSQIPWTWSSRLYDRHHLFTDTMIPERHFLFLCAATVDMSCPCTGLSIKLTL